MKRDILNHVGFFEEDGCWYARLEYIIEDDHTVSELIIPKVGIGINRHNHPVLDTSSNDFMDCRGHLNLGRMLFTIYPGVGHEGANRVLFTEKLIREKTVEMTIEDIEKKLGYKIKIVSEEGKGKK